MEQAARGSWQAPRGYPEKDTDSSDSWAGRLLERARRAGMLQKAARQKAR